MTTITAVTAHDVRFPTSLSDPTCVRATELLTQMYDAGALSTQGIFDGDAAAEAGVNLVMSPGAVWWGNYLFRDTWKIPAGQMSAVAPLMWDGDSEPSTGNEGGGLWGVSSHIKGKQLENALTFATFVATDPAWQVDLSTGLPGYGPVQDAWLDKIEADAYFADIPTVQQSFKDAASAVKARSRSSSASACRSRSRPLRWSRSSRSSRTGRTSSSRSRC